MTNDERNAKILARLKKFDNYTKEQAIEYLVRLGIYTKDGKLTKKYGG